jgi:preprotein translocase subunit SecF
VLLALMALLLFGGQAIHSFTATMMFGAALVGTYTSVFIASPILIYLGVGTSRQYAAGGAQEEITVESPPTVPGRTPAPAPR